ncbi:MAG: hypothetical protein V7K97_11620 [Nostoc sp.]|uniref:hypothetical protein n=1 Tax=Nostoc sp. TaxID=1180 RepID=UPI002FF8A7C5
MGKSTLVKINKQAGEYELGLGLASAIARIKVVFKYKVSWQYLYTHADSARLSRLP